METLSHSIRPMLGGHQKRVGGIPTPSPCPALSQKPAVDQDRQRNLRYCSFQGKKVAENRFEYFSFY